MDIYSWIALLTLFSAVFAVWKMGKRPKGQKLTLMEIAGVILNVVLMVMVYPPLCVAGGLIAARQAGGLIVAMGRLMPAVCVAGVGASVVLRRKGSPGISFLVQFAGGVWYGMTILLAMLFR